VIGLPAKGAETMNEESWMIMVDATGKVPGRQHKSKQDALSKARRLCENEGKSVYVMKTMGVFRAVVSPVFHEIKNGKEAW